MANRISREKLIKIGLSNEQMEKIVALHGADIEELKAKSDELINSKTEELKKANESLQSQIAERDKDLKSLKKQAGDNEELGNQLKELQGKYKHDTENLSKELQQTKLNSAVDSELGKAKVRNTKAAKALLNMDEVKLNDKGEVEGLDNQISSLQKSDSYLFDQGQKEPYQPQGGGAKTDPDLVATMANIFKGEDK
ncbi:phage scaffolding protein [Lactobacillus sp. ESL0228]|uniref:phage scaffolding protein n=1 Tax=Lactobacillus sp. ESL0228 TaxID=2069352 RepID=UPI001F290342|nr:phage scaffolding protein [Lactobacillus sp. ESL0228]